MVTGVIEQVPRYTISHTNDGTQERLQLTVSLPGLTSAKDFEVRIENDKFILRAEGRYNLTLPLHPPVEETAEVLQFVKRKAVLKAVLKVLSASDQAAAQPASPVSPSSSAASPSFANQRNQADGFWGRHDGTIAPDPDTDDESIPDLPSNASDFSPTSSLGGFPGRANGTASSASGQSTSTSHAQAHGQPYHQSPETDSDMSDTSPHVRCWSNGAGAMPAAEDSAHAAMHGNPLYGMSPASHLDAESSYADSADEAEGDSFLHPYSAFQQPQTKQSLETAAAYFKQGFGFLFTDDWRRAANLLFKAQLIEGTTCSLLPIGMGSLPAGLAADARHNIGAILLEKIDDRMQRNGSGAAKTMKAAWEQSHAVLLLQAIGHPAAAKYGLTEPAEASTSSRQEQRAPQAGTSRSSNSSRPSNLSRTQADAARSSDRQQSSAVWPNSATSSHADQDTSGSEASEQKEQQHQEQQGQGQQGQRAPAPTSASYSHGPAEQAEAKRQANKEAALTWLDKAKAAASNKDWTAGVQKAQKGLSLDPDADWASEANSLIQSWQAAQQKEAGSSGPADKQSGSGKAHAQAGKGQQQRQSKKQAKKQKRQAQQQQQEQQQQQQEAKQPHQDQPRQHQQQPKQQQEQPSSSKQHDRPRAADSEKSAHGQYSNAYGPQGQRTESAEPCVDSPSVASFEWLSAGMVLRHA